MQKTIEEIEKKLLCLKFHNNYECKVCPIQSFAKIGTLFGFSNVLLKLLSRARNSLFTNDLYP